MADLLVRGVDEALVRALKERAGAHGRSAEAEHREILRQALASEAEPDFARLAAELRRLTAGRAATPAEDLLREARDAR